VIRQVSRIILRLSLEQRLCAALAFAAGLLGLVVLVPYSLWNAIEPKSETFWGLIGALIGGGATILGTALQGKHDRSLATQQSQQDGLNAEKSERQSFIKTIHAIKSELEIVQQRYMATMGAVVTSFREGQAPPKHVFPVSMDYFPIYKNSVDAIGAIQDDVVRESLIRTYTLACGIIDSFRLNNSLIERYEDSDKEVARLDTPSTREIRRRCELDIAAYWVNIQESHSTLIASSTETIRLLNCLLRHERAVIEHAL